jgi:hypothetical protein
MLKVCTAKRENHFEPSVKPNGCILIADIVAKVALEPSESKTRNNQTFAPAQHSRKAIELCANVVGSVRRRSSSFSLRSFTTTRACRMRRSRTFRPTTTAPAVMDSRIGHASRSLLRSKHSNRLRSGTNSIRFDGVVLGNFAGRHVSSWHMAAEPGCPHSRRVSEGNRTADIVAAFREGFKRMGQGSTFSFMLPVSVEQQSISE